MGSGYPVAATDDTCPCHGHAACTWGVPGWMEKTEPVSFVCVSFSREGLGEAGIVDSSCD